MLQIESHSLVMAHILNNLNTMTAGAWVGQAVDHPIVTLSSHLRGGFPCQI